MINISAENGQMIRNQGFTWAWPTNKIRPYMSHCEIAD